MSPARSCAKCDEQLEEHVNFCPICGHPVRLARETSLGVVDDLSTLPEPGPLGKISGLLLGILLAATVIITYVAGVAAVALAFGAPLLHGMIVATVLAVGAGVAGLYYWRKRQQ